MLVVVGGHSRNIGKTSVVAGLIRKLRDRKWTALKITQYGNGVCANHTVAAGCGCEPDGGEEFALTEEYEANGTDTGRFLAAGAERSFWLRVPSGELPRAAGMVNKILAQGENVIVESNSVVELVTPDVFLMLLDFSCEDFKASSLRFMDRADAFVVIDRGINAPLWEEVARGMWDGKPQFLVKPPRYVTAEVAEFVKAKISVAIAALSTQAGQRGAGIGKPAIGMRQLLLNGTKVAAAAHVRGFALQFKAVDAGFDIAEVLAKIVNQIDEDRFRRRNLV